ncbi:hypothetical protein [Paenibacillus agaridevorans]|uniref:hypothetical protein n=1 Tax=Paenibacillus agaridevorans TaxID=171404 RepID=UPI002484CA41|nr:hypothetical protein [Paenibacillus agaridevorans]
MGYEHFLKNHILPTFGSMKMTDVKPMHILSFLDSLTRNGARKDGKNGGLSTTTTRFIHRVLKDIKRGQLVCDNRTSSAVNWRTLWFSSYTAQRLKCVHFSSITSNFFIMGYKNYCYPLFLI